MRRPLGWVLVSWAGAVLGVALGVVAGNWTAAAYAFANAVSAAGWAVATRQAAEWQGLAEGYAEWAARFARGWGDDHPDDGAPTDWRGPPSGPRG